MINDDLLKLIRSKEHNLNTTPNHTHLTVSLSEWQKGTSLEDSLTRPFCLAMWNKDNETQMMIANLEDVKGWGMLSIEPKTRDAEVLRITFTKLAFTDAQQARMERAADILAELNFDHIADQITSAFRFTAKVEILTMDSKTDLALEACGDYYTDLTDFVYDLETALDGRVIDRV